MSLYGLARALPAVAETRRKWAVTGLGLGAIPLFANLGIGVEGGEGGTGGGTNTPAATAERAGKDVAEAWARGFDDAWESEAVQRIGSLVDDLFTNANYEGFAVAGQDSAEKFYDGLESAFRNSTNREFVYGSLNGLILGINLKGVEFSAAGALLGGALIGGITDGLNVNAVTLNGALQLLAGSLATDAVVTKWSEAGDVLGRAVTEGIGAGFDAGKVMLVASLGTVRVAILLQTDEFTVTGAALGIAVIGGINKTVLARIPLVVLALQAVALATIAATREWATAGVALAAAFMLALTNSILDATEAVTAAVTSLVAQLDLNMLVGAGLDIGTAIVAGLIQGILNGRELVAQAARAIALAAAVAAQQELQVNSPSRVFIKLGESTGEGLGLGIEQSTGLAVTAASDAAAAVINATTTALQPGLLNGFDLTGSADSPNKFGRQVVEAMRASGLTVDFKSDGYWYVNDKRASTGPVQEDQTARIFTSDRALMERIVKAVSPVLGGDPVAKTAAQLAAAAASVAKTTAALSAAVPVTKMRDYDQFTPGTYSGVGTPKNFDRRPGGTIGQFYYRGEWYDDAILQLDLPSRRTSAALPGAGSGAALSAQVDAASLQAIYNQQQATSTTDQSVVEQTTFNVYGNEPRETAAEIAQRQRSRRYLNGGKR